MKRQIRIIPENNLLENELLIQKVLIDKELAIDLLKRMPKNRRVKKSNVIKIIESIKESSWIENNGETIKIDKFGKLIDGQHRLEAVIQSGLPIKTYITFNCETDSINTIDTGASRSLSDILKLNNVKYSQYVGIIVQSENVIIRGNSVTETSGYTKYKNSKRVLDVVLQNEEYLNFICKTGVLLRSKFSLISISLLVKYLNVTWKIDQSISSSFFNEICTGKNCESSTYLFRQAIIKDASKNVKKYSLIEKEALLVKAWNNYVEGKELKTLKWNRSTEGFPKMKRVELIKNKF